MLKHLVLLGFIAVVSADYLPPHTYLPSPHKAVVTIVGNGQNNVAGVVYFTETSQGIDVNGSITGLTQGKHGFHVHVFGDLSGGCLSTGGHFNPTNSSHGAPNSSERHVGDLGNIEANADGVAVINITDKIIALSGVNNIIGRGIVVHQDPDDLGLGGFEDSKTTGHAGARVGCGVIGTLDETNSAGPGAAMVVLPSLLTVFVVAIHRLV